MSFPHVTLPLKKSGSFQYEATQYRISQHETKANKYRNEFAHPDGMDLRNKYNFSQPQSKENIRNLLRCFDEAEKEMDNYFIKIDGVPKMREK